MQHSQTYNEREEEEISYEDYLFDQCQQFRILLIGKAGVGKSSLLSAVFNLSDAEAGIRHQGQGKGQHSVWNGFVSRNNPLLIIHDSGGFEAAETSNLDDIKRFISTCSKKYLLADQLHCIWYCIDCTDTRFWSEAEKQFMAFFKNSVVPIIFVLTKFDRVVAECCVDRLSQGGRPMDDYMTIRAQASKDADAKVKESVIKPLQRYIIEDIRTATVSVKEPELVQQLVEATTNVVRPALRHLWISAQRVLAHKKRELAINTSIGVITTGYVKAGNLITLPFARPLFHQDIFPRMYDAIRHKWNVPDNFGVLDGTQTAAKFESLCRPSNLQSVGSAIVKTIDPTGPLLSPHYTREYLRWAADLNLLFEMLFWKHKELAERAVEGAQNGHRGRRERALRNDDLDKALELYKNSNVRDKAHGLIAGKVRNLDLSTPFKPKVLAEVLGMAVGDIKTEGEKEGFWETGQGSAYGRPGRSGIESLAEMRSGMGDPAEMQS